MKDFKKALGNRIRTLRERLGLSQKELADSIGFPAHQIISQIETGERDVKAWELFKLANILKVDTSALLAPDQNEIIPIVLWRESPGKDKKLIEADFLKKCKDYRNLEKAASVQNHSKLPKKNIDIKTIDYHVVSEIADEVSRELDLGRKPALALEKVLEDQYGVKIWYEDLGEKGSAASTFGSFGPAIMMNSKQAPWKRNYNFAHELFHLIIWDSLPPDILMKNQRLFEEFEKYANAFASALLLPAESMLNEYRKRLKNSTINYADLIDIAREFDVSSEALLYRLCNLNQIKRKSVEELLNNPDFKKIDKASMYGLWWDPPPFPKRFVLLGFKAYQKGNVSRSKLAKYLETSLCDLRVTLLEYGFDEDEDYEITIRTA